MNRLMTKLADDYRELTEQYETVLNRCADEDRDPTEPEAGVLDGLRTQMEPLGSRLIELRETDDRRFAAVRAMADAPNIPGSDRLPVVQVRSEPDIYRRDGGNGAERTSFFRDLLHAQLDHDRDASGRLERHSMQVRAAGTTTTGAGVLPPNWLFEEFAIIAHGARQRRGRRKPATGRDLPDANPVNIGISRPRVRWSVCSPRRTRSPPTGTSTPTC